MTTVCQREPKTCSSPLLQGSGSQADP